MAVSLCRRQCGRDSCHGTCHNTSERYRVREFVPKNRGHHKSDDVVRPDYFVGRRADRSLPCPKERKIRLFVTEIFCDAGEASAENEIAPNEKGFCRLAGIPF